MIVLTRFYGAVLPEDILLDPRAEIPWQGVDWTDGWTGQDDLDGRMEGRDALDGRTGGTDWVDRRDGLDRRMDGLDRQTGRTGGRDGWTGWTEIETDAPREISRCLCQMFPHRCVLHRQNMRTYAYICALHVFSYVCFGTREP